MAMKRPRGRFWPAISAIRRHRVRHRKHFAHRVPSSPAKSIRTACFPPPEREANLTHLNPDWAPARSGSRPSLDRHREHLLRAFLPPRGGLTVALHNNSEAYTVAAELAPQRCGPRSANPPIRTPSISAPTRPISILSASGYNAVLQHAKPATDDGSLSRVARCAAPLCQRGSRPRTSRPPEGNARLAGVGFTVNCDSFRPRGLS